MTSVAFALGSGAWATYLFEPVNPVTRSLLFLIPFALFAVGLIYDIARKDTTSKLPPVVAQLISLQRRSYLKMMSYQEMLQQLSPQQRSELGKLIAGKPDGGQFMVMGRGKSSRVGAITRFVLLNLALGAALLALHAALVWIALPDAAQIAQIAQHVQLHLLKEASGKIRYKSVANELYAPLDNMSNAMQEAVIMREDPAFRMHWGFNPRRKLISVGMSVAHVATFGMVGRKQGGSTITEQLAKNLFLSGDSGLFSGIRRKFKEQILAFKLEAYYSKDEILEMYLNLVHFGRGAQGVEAAARLYFNRQSDELDQVDAYEAAIFAQSLTAPTQNNCVRNREDTENTVALLRAFGASGERASYPAIEKYLEAQKRGDKEHARQYNVAKAKLRNLNAERRLDAMPLSEIINEIRTRERTAVQVRNLFEKMGMPIKEALLAQTIERCVQNGQRDLIVPEPGYFLDWILPEIRQSDYFDDLNGDFTVVTTMDARMQRFAQEAMKATFRNSANNGLFSQENMPQAALIAMTPNGAVQAMMGGARRAGRLQSRHACGTAARLDLQALRLSDRVRAGLDAGKDRQRSARRKELAEQFARLFADAGAPD